MDITCANLPLPGSFGTLVRQDASARTLPLMRKPLSMHRVRLTFPGLGLLRVGGHTPGVPAHALLVAQSRFFIAQRPYLDAQCHREQRLVLHGNRFLFFCAIREIDPDGTGNERLGHHRRQRDLRRRREPDTDPLCDGPSLHDEHRHVGYRCAPNESFCPRVLPCISFAIACGTAATRSRCTPSPPRVPI